MKIAIKNLDNKKVKEIDLPESIFGCPYREHLIHTAVQAYLSSLRRGTHQTKTRAEVAGSGRKLWRQKGTGRARAGSAASPLRRSGGVAHGPHPRSYQKGLSAQEKRGALRSVLSRKLKEDGIVILDSFELDSHKTAELTGRLERLGITGKALLVDRFDNHRLHYASRNVPGLKAVDALALNVYDVVARAHLVMSEDALGRITEVLSK